ncbi:ImmA/IrrE family metallo-endopeptidase [bacterium]|nr:ImmA/IrrE family metallo-endopeptidase [bacterium]
MQTAFGLALGVVDELVTEVLQQVGMAEPPVDAVEVARGLGMDVRLHTGQQERGRLVHAGGWTVIVCRPEPRLERYQWTVAHEIGEYLMAQTADRWASELVVLDGAVREWLSNCFATHLLTPREWFLADARELDYDLTELKRRYVTASHEVIALRTLESDSPAVVTIFDNGKQTRRLGNLRYRVPDCSPAERTCRLLAHDAGAAQSQEIEGVRIRAWPLHEDEWKREIVRTEWFEGWID